MNSSGIKRGMAALAISALAVSGIPALTSTAFANSVDTQVGPGRVELYNTDVAISQKNDGTDTTVRLQAGAGANIQTVRFEYQLTGDLEWQQIEDVARNDDGSFSFEWTPTADPYNLPNGVEINIRATGLVGTTVTGAFDQTDGIDLINTSPTVDTINVAAGSALGNYNPSISNSPGACFGINNVIVSGTSSVASTADADAPSLSWVDGLGASMGARDADHSGTSFSGIVDLDGYTYAAAPVFPVTTQEPDQLVTRAVTQSTLRNTEDFESYTLYQQVPTTVTATDDGTNTSPDPANITVTVLDQNGEPIADAEVRGNNGGGTEWTDSMGEAHFVQFPNTQYYFVDANCEGGGFSPQDDDVRSPNIVNTGPSSVAIASNPAGAVAVGSSVTETVTILNGSGNPQPNETVRITRTGPGAQDEVEFLITDANGQASYVFTCSSDGSATVNAAIYDPNSPNNWENFNRSVTDTVQCGDGEPGTDGGRTNVVAKLGGINNAGKNDKVRIKAPRRAAGAAVQLFKVVQGNRTRVRGANGRLNADGFIRLTARDTNGRQITKYVADVKRTSLTNATRTNAKKIR